MNCTQVRQLCADMGEGLEVRSYERFAPLEVEPAGLRGGYRKVQPGDAVVAFSRATIFTIKKVFLRRLMEWRAHELRPCCLTSGQGNLAAACGLKPPRVCLAAGAPALLAPVSRAAGTAGLPCHLE
jgi:hypothetical protein